MGFRWICSPVFRGISKIENCFQPLAPAQNRQYDPNVPGSNPGTTIDMRPVAFAPKQRDGVLWWGAPPRTDLLKRNLASDQASQRTRPARRTKCQNCRSELASNSGPLREESGPKAPVFENVSTRNRDGHDTDTWSSPGENTRNAETTHYKDQRVPFTRRSRIGCEEAGELNLMTKCRNASMSRSSRPPTGKQVDKAPAVREERDTLIFPF